MVINIWFFRRYELVCFSDNYLLQFLQLQHHNERWEFSTQSQSCLIFLAIENGERQQTKRARGFEKKKARKVEKEKEKVMRLAWGTCPKLGPCHYADESRQSLRVCYLYLPATRVQDGAVYKTRIRNTGGIISRWHARIIPRNA